MSFAVQLEDVYRKLHVSARGNVQSSPRRRWSDDHRAHAAAARSSFSALRITILSASSGNGRCSAFASSHGARIQTSRSSVKWLPQTESRLDLWVKVTSLSLGHELAVYWLLISLR